MPDIIDYGYLDLNYLEEPYLTEVRGHGVYSQVNLVIADFPHQVLSEVDRQCIDFPHDVRSEVDRQIADYTHAVFTEITRGKNPHLTKRVYLEGGYLEEPYLTEYMCVLVRSQVDRLADETHEVFSQVNRTILDYLHPVLSETERRIDTEHAVRSQIARTIVDFPHPVFSEVERFIVDFLHPVRSEIERKIDTEHAVRSQIQRLEAHIVYSQVTQVLYNTTNLRIMCDFPSRGTSGTNWTSNSTAAGDFSPYNLNTDIVEEVWRSDFVLSGIVLTCDTELPQGVFTDTLAFLNHNLTTSASVVWQRSNDPGFATVDTVVFTITVDNFIWVAPTLPLSGYRYHRFQISDPTNSNAYLEIGTIVFGPSIIFQGECFVDRVVKGTKHFSDKVLTEGFTNISNDRAVKYNVALEFKNLNFGRGNYRNIRAVFDYARTSLKCLWIPTPQYPLRFFTFAKLAAIPDESHNVKSAALDYIDFNILTDESL